MAEADVLAELVEDHVQDQFTLIMDSAEILKASASEFVSKHHKVNSDDALTYRQVAFDLLKMRGWSNLATLLLPGMDRYTMIADEYVYISKKEGKKPMARIIFVLPSKGWICPETMQNWIKVVDDVEFGRERNVCKNEIMLAMVDEDSLTTYYDLVLGLEPIAARHAKQFG